MSANKASELRVTDEARIRAIGSPLPVADQSHVSPRCRGHLLPTSVQEVGRVGAALREAGPEGRVRAAAAPIEPLPCGDEGADGGVGHMLLRGSAYLRSDPLVSHREG